MSRCKLVVGMLTSDDWDESKEIILMNCLSDIMPLRKELTLKLNAPPTHQSVEL